jgi:exonuclease SbcD
MTRQSPEADYLSVTLLDNQPILDARSRLSEVYPNILDFSYLRLQQSGEFSGPGVNYQKLGEEELFASFFEQMTGERITSEQQAEFNNTLAEVYQAKREAV